MRLSEGNDWRDDNLDFLHSLPDLTELEVYNWNIRDISPISTLKQLEHISVECNYRKSIDFTVFTKLKSCYLRWRPGSDSIFAVSSLNALNIVNYPDQSLEPLQALSNLTKLTLSSSKLKHLSGISQLTSLSLLDLYRCVKLESIQGIEQLSELKVIEIDCCKKVEDLSPLKSLKQLTRLCVNNCAMVLSLQPIATCRNLTDIFFVEDTNVKDGDLSFYVNLPRLNDMWFANRKHYSHTREQVEQDLKVRRTE